ncbi:MAG: hypothetical protein MUE74_08570 [Bacteroidales bacterium]|nr:hypothetical protein [Bacteroidales bacterium]
MSVKITEAAARYAARLNTALPERLIPAAINARMTAAAANKKKRIRTVVIMKAV